ncbi:transglycosylase domain-containing protein [Vaginisenegalia massiliensis]|uniref:transglycosylase domain-containing protein n=1 Tax=Vaginisenegalia massiliensis TaxID=2058294 RepID=UPI001F14C1E8|nr:PBP1A family penicillin-binding protein [Vaginisenegalia massiliensis]
MNDHYFDPHQMTRKQRIWQGIKNLWQYYRGWKWLIFIGMSLALVTSSYLVLIAKTTDVATLQNALMSKTTIYDMNDAKAGTLSSQKGSYVELDHVSQQMRDTLIATEDKRFYQHNGFDSIGIGRALVRAVIRRNASGGGGSTLTQQLVKNAFLSSDQTIERKLKELFLALEVEKQFTKDQILEMYLNHAYFGNGVWGIEDASLKYFGHSADSLNWNESMVLTGILKGPSLYNPIDEYQGAIDRRNVIADLLLKQGIITADDANYVKNSPITLNDAYASQAGNEFPYYFDAVITEAVSEANIPEDELMAKGYKIYTNLNTGYQSAIDSAYANSNVFPDDGTGQPLVQSASVVVSPKTGGIMAVYGGRGDYVYRGFNRAVSMKRSPGSTIKPLAIYTPALENNFNIHSQVPDVVKAYGSDHYAPENYDRQTDPSGEVPLYLALAQSKNTTAVYLMDKLGIDRSVKKLSQFGINIKEEDRSLTLALGALREGVSPVQLASAYAAFANGGVRQDSYFIRRIEDADGNVVYANEKPKKHMVMTPKVAADMTSMMLDTYGGYGTGYGAGPASGQIAGKTGSTEISQENMATRDKWMVGYTPDFVVVSWVGLDREEQGQSLDDLMPSGIRELFSIQTTNLMANSPQTPFAVGMASQMKENSNDGVASGIDDQVNQVFQEGKDWFDQNGSNLWEQGKQKANEIWNGVSDWAGNLLNQ